MTTVDDVSGRGSQAPALEATGRREHERDPISFELSTSPAAAERVDALVVGAFEDGTLPPAAQAIDAATEGKLSALAGRGDLDSKRGSSMLLYDLPGMAASRVLLVSLGKREDFNDQAFFEVFRGAADALVRGSARTAAVTLAELDLPPQRSLAWRLQHGTRALADGAYRFPAPGIDKSKELEKVRERSPRRIVWPVADDATPELATAVRRGQAVADGMALTRDLGNLPGNVCHPAYLADTARALGDELGLTVEILEREDMERLGMHSALSVGRASAHPCKLIVMRYEGDTADSKPVVLVGKGITFDTGGISLKPGADLDEMKFDMCGAASVFGAVSTAARLQLPINLVGVVPAHENMPGGDATRPGDVVTSMSGQTIEILNTDAEGRLILCDALTYSERFDPACVIDIATLTGACVIALGTVTSGLFANDDALAAELLRCGTDTGDRAWQLPLWDDYQVQLKSNFADMSNLGGRPAGTITAACFLSRFTKKYKWAHLDIAGTASVSGDAKGATGRPVPMLAEFLIRHAEGAAA